MPAYMIGILPKHLHVMQLANVERRLAKRGLGGSFARARAFYRAATEELMICMGDPSSGVHAEKTADVSSRGQEEEQGALHRASQQPVATQKGGAGDGRVLPQHPGGSPSAGCAGPDAGSEVPVLQSHLVRGLQSWARMEGFLG